MAGIDKPVWTLTSAILDFFGKRPGQSNTEFLEELRALTSEDKAQFKEMLEERGYKFA